MTAVPYAIVAKTATDAGPIGTVLNTVLWDGGTDWTPPAETEAVAIPDGTPVGIGWSYANSTFAAPPSTTPAPTAAQVAQAAYAALVAGGLTVTSTGTPALSGVYAIDPQSQQDIATEAQFISTFSEFTTGGTTNLPWILMNGAVVMFPTTTEFLAFAKAAAQLVAAAKLAAAQAEAMPAATATIP